VPAHDFEFSIDVSGGTPFDDLLRDLTAQVTDHLGGATDVIAGIAEPLNAAVARATAAARGCKVWFRRAGRTLEIEVTSGAGRIWQASRTIP
jgi:hypothetical protein